MKRRKSKVIERQKVWWLLTRTRFSCLSCFVSNFTTFFNSIFTCLPSNAFTDSASNESFTHTVRIRAERKVARRFWAGQSSPFLRKMGRPWPGISRGIEREPRRDGGRADARGWQLGSGRKQAASEARDEPFRSFVSCDRVDILLAEVFHWSSPFHLTRRRPCLSSSPARSSPLRVLADLGECRRDKGRCREKTSRQHSSSHVGTCPRLVCDDHRWSAATMAAIRL